MTKQLLLLLAACLGSLSVASLAQDAWDRYKPGTLAEIVAYDEPPAALVDKKNTISIEGSEFVRRIRVVYEGQSRPVSSDRLKIIEIWAKSHRVKGSAASLFKEEFLFSEGPEKYWLPMQKSLVGFLRKESAKGDRVNLWVNFIGALVTPEKRERIILINAYTKEESPIEPQSK